MANIVDRRLQHRSVFEPCISWKDRLKERLLARVKQQRGQIVDHVRRLSSAQPRATAISSTAASILDDEWCSLKRSDVMLDTPGLPGDQVRPDDVFPTGTPPPAELSGDEYLQIVHFIEQSLYADLRREEEMLCLVQPYEEFEHAHLTAATEAFYDPPLNFVLCPVCRQHKLLENKGVIFCACGLRLDVKSDTVGLKYLHERLTELLREHSAVCSGEPGFAVQERFGIVTLCMSCATCATFHVVI